MSRASRTGPVAWGQLHGASRTGPVAQGQLHRANCEGPIARGEALDENRGPLVNESEQRRHEQQVFHPVRNFDLYGRKVNKRSIGL